MIVCEAVATFLLIVLRIMVGHWPPIAGEQPHSDHAVKGSRLFTAPTKPNRTVSGCICVVFPLSIDFRLGRGARIQSICMGALWQGSVQLICVLVSNQSSAAAAMTCFPRGRECSPMRTSHTESARTMRGFLSSIFKSLINQYPPIDTYSPAPTHMGFPRFLRCAMHYPLISVLWRASGE